jgi:hypothetical protein
MRGGQVQQLMSAQGVQNAIMQRAERFRATAQDKKDTKATDSENTSATSSAVRVAQVIATTRANGRGRRAHSAPRAGSVVMLTGVGACGKV